MFFPIAEIEVQPFLPPLVAFGISFFASMGGISGAFMLLPFQMSFLGYTNPSVSATNQLFNIIAIPSGVYRYWREGRLIWPLVYLVVIGTLPGVFLGALIRIMYLPDPRHFKLFVALVLLYIGVKLFMDMRKNMQSASYKTKQAAEKNEVSQLEGAPQSDGQDRVTVHSFSLRKLAFSYRHQEYTIPCLGVLGLSFTVGIVGGIYGIGGGAIIAPFFVTFFKLPIYIVAGATLMGTLVTSVAAVLFYEAISPLFPALSVSPDWLLGLLFGIGGAGGMYLGARCQRFVSATFIKALLTFAMGFTALKYIWDFFA